jgi:hypothetical protein
MSHRSFVIGIILSLFLFSFSARSQVPAPTKESDDGAALKEKASELLASVAGQVESLRSGENRARIGSNAAEAIWEHDEKRARSLFAAVGEVIRTGFADADPDRERHNRTLLVFWQLRSDTIGRIAKHDPELALEFLRATRLPSGVHLPYQGEDTENSLEMRLAVQVATKSPELALKLGQESLAKGFSQDLLVMLSAVQNKEASQRLFQAVVEKLRAADMSQDPGAIRFAIGLASTYQPPQSDERVYRDLIGVLLAGAMANGCGESPGDEGPGICYEIATMFPKLEKYYGVRAASLKKWVPEDLSGRAGYDLWLQAREIAEKGTVDEILAVAEKNPENQDTLYEAAISKAMAAGDVARAKLIASNFPSQDQRTELIARIDLAQKRLSTNPNNPATVQEALRTFDTDEERLDFLFGSAGRLAASDRKAALLFLNEAGSIIDSSKGRMQLEGQVVLAIMYCSLNDRRGFEIVESLIPRLNQLVEAAAILDGVETNYLSSEEWNMTGAGELGRLLTVLAQNAGWFARLDFERAVTIANQLERNELRLMTKLKIAQGVLVNQPNPFRMFQSPYAVP